MAGCTRFDEVLGLNICNLCGMPPEDGHGVIADDDSAKDIPCPRADLPAAAKKLLEDRDRLREAVEWVEDYANQPWSSEGDPATVTLPYQRIVLRKAQAALSDQKPAEEK